MLRVFSLVYLIMIGIRGQNYYFEFSIGCWFFGVYCLYVGRVDFMNYKFVFYRVVENLQKIYVYVQWIL